MNFQDQNTQTTFQKVIDIAQANGYKYPLSVAEQRNDYFKQDWSEYEITGKLFKSTDSGLGDFFVAAYIVGAISKECVVMSKYVLHVN